MFQCYFNDTVFGKIIFSDISHHITSCSRERGSVMVEFWALNKEVLGSIPTGSTVLCP